MFKDKKYISIDAELLNFDKRETSLLCWAQEKAIDDSWMETFCRFIPRKNSLNCHFGGENCHTSAFPRTRSTRVCITFGTLCLPATPWFPKHIPYVAYWSEGQFSQGRLHSFVLFKKSIFFSFFDSIKCHKASLS